jgi:hypothetical protein
MSEFEEKDLKAIKSDVNDLSKKVSEIYSAIMGTQFNEKGGYKPRLESLESRVEVIEDLITKWKWILVGAIGLGGYGGLTFIQELISVIGNVLSKK